uniref:WLM domain-containing protein n=1 Tax=viral metagenome TaxID=1070528 RepID=A0A6C0I868_9ZZZZ
MDKEILINCLITVSIITGLFIFYFYVYDGTILVRSTLDSQEYYVRNSSNSQLKANMLSLLNMKLNILVDSLSKEPNKTIPIERLIQNWNQKVTLKEIGNMETDAAYVINKKYMSFCLKAFNKEPVTLEHINLFTYVGIHELAHVMSIEVGHGDEFKINFKYLLDYSKYLKYTDPLLNKEIPLYIPLNTLKYTPKDYCGVSIINSIS